MENRRVLFQWDFFDGHFTFRSILTQKLSAKGEKIIAQDSFVS